MRPSTGYLLARELSAKNIKQPPDYSRWLPFAEILMVSEECHLRGAPFRAGERILCVRAEEVIIDDKKLLIVEESDVMLIF